MYDSSDSTDKASHKFCCFFSPRCHTSCQTTCQALKLVSDILGHFLFLMQPNKLFSAVMFPRYAVYWCPISIWKVKHYTQLIIRKRFFLSEPRCTVSFFKTKKTTWPVTFEITLRDRSGNQLWRRYLLLAGLPILLVDRFGMKFKLAYIDIFQDLYCLAISVML